MNPLVIAWQEFSKAFESIVKTGIYFRDNEVTLTQAGLILLLPQVTTYLLKYNSRFGIDIGIVIENYPLLLFVFLTASVYIAIEPAIIEKTAGDLTKIGFLSIHLFAFALSLNLVYAMLLQLVGADDFIAAQIRNAAQSMPNKLSEAAFAGLYGTPFIAASVLLLLRNSYVAYREKGGILREVLGVGIFWRSTGVILFLAVYQYMAFIIIGSSVSGSTPN